LNPVKATNDDTHEQICFEKEAIFTASEVAAAIGQLNPEKQLVKMKSDSIC